MCGVPDGRDPAVLSSRGRDAGPARRRRDGRARRAAGARPARWRPTRSAEALAEQAGQNQRLGRILVVNGLVSDEALGAALSRQSGIGQIDLAASPPDPTLLAGIDPYRCLALEAVPWRQVGGTRVVAIGNPERAEAAMAACGGGAAKVALALAAPQDDPPGADRGLRRPAARRRAGALSGGLQLPRLDRDGRPAGARARAGGGGAGGDGGGAAPRAAAAARLGAARQRHDDGAAADRALHPGRRGRGWRPSTPVRGSPTTRSCRGSRSSCRCCARRRWRGGCSRRCEAMDYPAALLDIKLVLEADDAITRAAIAARRAAAHHRGDQRAARHAAGPSRRR